jgi:hypothetical protein
MPTYEEIWGKGQTPDRDIDALRRLFDPGNAARTIGSGAQRAAAMVLGIPGDLSDVLSGRTRDVDGTQSNFPTYRGAEAGLSNLTGIPYQRPNADDPSAIAAMPFLRLAAALPMLMFGGTQQPAPAPQPPPPPAGGIFGGLFQSSPYQQPGPRSGARFFPDAWPFRSFKGQSSDRDANGFPDTGPLR